MTKLFREYIKQNPQLWNDELKARIYSIAETMVDLEDRFIELAFGVSDMKRLTKQEVKDYIRYLAARRLMGLGLKQMTAYECYRCDWSSDVCSSDLCLV